LRVALAPLIQVDETPAPASAHFNDFVPCEDVIVSSLRTVKSVVFFAVWACAVEAPYERRADQQMTNCLDITTYMAAPVRQLRRDRCAD
jgi:hypothetical protein